MELENKDAVTFVKVPYSFFAQNLNTSYFSQKMYLKFQRLS